MRGALALMRAAMLLVCLPGAPAQAHEVQPAIANFSVDGDTLRLELVLSLESYLSGVDLDGLADMDRAEGTEAYEALRALPPEALAARVPGLIARWSQVPLVRFGDAPAALSIESLSVPEVGNPELLRSAEMVVTAPVGGPLVRFEWPRGAGVIVLRQEPVRQPYTGFLRGGDRSPPIALAGGGSAGAWAAGVSHVPAGFAQVLPGAPVLVLFVLGLGLRAGGRARALLWQLGALAAAQLAGLSLGAAGLAALPAGPLGALLAASLVYVGVENIAAARMPPWRSVPVFAFGLAHGLALAGGFSAALAPVGLFGAALAGLALGTLIGLLAVLAGGYLLVFAALDRPWYRARVAVPASAVLAAVGGVLLLTGTVH